MAETFDKQVHMASVYAEALFALAQGGGQADAVRAELDELVELERIEPSFKAFMTSSSLDDDHRAAGLEKMLRGKISDMTLNTLQVMNRNGRYGMTDALRRAFVLRQEQAAGQVEVTATSAVELGPEQRQRVAEAAARMSGRNPVMAFRIDPEILGGLIVQIGDLRYDNSVRRQLREARGRLMERGEKGLAVGVENG